MRIALLHTNPYYQEIEELILDINSNFKVRDFQLFEIKYSDFKWYKLSKIIELRRFLKINKIDIIHTYHYLDAFYALLASKGLNVKVVYSCYFYYDNIKGFHKRAFEKVLNNVDSIIFQTDTQKDRFVSKYNLDSHKHFKLLHAFSLKRFDKFKFDSLRDEFFIDDFRYVIGTLGDFTPDHDVMNVLKMVKKLRKTGRNFTCLVAGEQIDGYDSYFVDCKYYYLSHGLDNYINFIGHRYDVVNYLSQLDVFVYHSDNEAIAIPVIQALISGVNVVANDNEMIREITRNGKYASLYKSNDVVDFADKTRQILNDIEDYQLIAETVKEECREIFSIDKHVSGLRDIYIKVKKY
ncbi:MAG: glycosyltransferase family 4 protein [Bacteroidales bacterium]|nr:glycosyltransferase family 4 protein [Bacteroidales bacterium]